MIPRWASAFVPVVLVYVKSIRMQDEFNQRIHYSTDLLFQAGFIPQFPSTGLGR